MMAQGEQQHSQGSRNLLCRWQRIPVPCWERCWTRLGKWPQPLL